MHGDSSGPQDLAAPSGPAPRRPPTAASESLDVLLATRFGRSAFRPGQRLAIEAALAGRDGLVCLPTGAGKSLCYQLAALALRARGRGPTWVVSPLTALMNDQAAALTARGVRALAWHSGLGAAAARAATRSLAAGAYDLLFLSAERAVLPAQLALARRHEVALLAVDEAHCISQWGHDFRPEYRALGTLKRACAGPAMALTATATRETRADIERALGLVAPARVLGPVLRENLAFAVAPPRPLKLRLAALAAWARAEPAAPRAADATPWPAAAGATLIYASTRKVVEAATAVLRSAGLVAAAYHAGLPAAERLALERSFLSGEQQLLVATCAFGMGLDRPDVRRVLHLQGPGRLEALYQEAGRAGRDGALSEATLWWGPQDWLVQRRLALGLSPRGQAAALAGLAAMQAYVARGQCRQQQLARAFGEATDGPACGRCDVCCAPRTIPAVADALSCARASRARSARSAEAAELAERARPAVSAAVAARLDALVLRFMAAVPRPLGRRLLAQALRGSRAQPVCRRRLHALPGAGEAAGVALADIEARIAALLAAGQLVARGRKYPTVWLAGRPQRARRAAVPSGSASPGGPGPPAATRLRRALARFSRRQARALQWPKAYMVLPKAVQREIARTRPTSLAALAEVRGLGPRKVALFGAALVALVAEDGAPGEPTGSRH